MTKQSLVDCNGKSGRETVNIKIHFHNDHIFYYNSLTYKVKKEDQRQQNCYLSHSTKVYCFFFLILKDKNQNI